MNSQGDAAGKKVRKPYTITKSRESWTDEEHDKFIEALQLFDRDWKKIEDFVGSKTVIQIRSHAQKYFLKVQKNGAVAHVPPPRPKRKATQPYPQKAPKNVLMPLQASMAYPSASINSLASGYATWDDASVLVHHATNGDTPSENEYDILLAKVVIKPGALTSLEFPNRRKQGSVIHGIPDFAEVYSFIGSIFDPRTRDHVQKLKEMDPINFETVLMLMKNLTVNLSSPDFKLIKKVLSSHDTSYKTVAISAGSPISAEYSPSRAVSAGLKMVRLEMRHSRQVEAKNVLGMLSVASEEEKSSHPLISAYPVSSMRICVSFSMKILIEVFQLKSSGSNFFPRNHKINVVVGR